MTVATLGRRVLVATVACAAAVGLASAPASANDKTVAVRVGGEVVARASWDDSRDRLCVTVLKNSARDYGRVGIRSAQGLPEPDRAIRQWSAEKRQGTQCSPNLSIREDALYEMQLQWWDYRNGNLERIKSSATVTFYT